MRKGLSRLIAPRTHIATVIIRVIKLLTLQVPTPGSGGGCFDTSKLDGGREGWRY